MNEPRRCNGGCGLPLEGNEVHLTKDACVAALKQRLVLCVRTGQKVQEALVAARHDVTGMCQVLFALAARKNGELVLDDREIAGVPEDGYIEQRTDKEHGLVTFRALRKQGEA